MTWLFTVMSMTVIAVVAGVVTGLISGGLQAPVSAVPARGLPPDPIGAEDLRALRLNAAVRGYRMAEVDHVLERLGAELRWRDDELARLRSELREPRVPFGYSAAPLTDSALVDSALVEPDRNLPSLDGLWAPSLPEPDSELDSDPDSDSDSDSDPEPDSEPEPELEPSASEVSVSEGDPEATSASPKRE